MRLSNFLIIYDIFDSKRLYRVRKNILPYILGGQKSAFEAPLNSKSIKEIFVNIEPIIELEDKINIIKVVGEPILLGKAQKLKLTGVINENSNN